MYQNYVVEIRKSHSGEFEHNVLWVWDENATVAEQKALAKFYEVLSRAAVSDTAELGATVYFKDGTTTTVTEGRVTHPGNLGMERIADAIIEILDI